jgi:hypothetical protein
MRTVRSNVWPVQLLSPGLRPVPQPGSSSRPLVRRSRVCAPRFRIVGPRNTAVSAAAAKMMTIPRTAIGTEATCPAWRRTDAGRFRGTCSCAENSVLERSRPISAALCPVLAPEPCCESSGHAYIILRIERLPWIQEPQVASRNVIERKRERGAIPHSEDISRFPP